MRESRLVTALSWHSSGDGTALDGQLTAGVDVSHVNGRLEVRDGGRRRFVLGVVIVVGGLIIDFGEKLGGDPGAALCRTYLGVIYRSAEGVLGGRSLVGASFPGEVNQHGGTGLGVLGAVNPGIRGA